MQLLILTCKHLIFYYIFVMHLAHYKLQNIQLGIQNIVMHCAHHENIEIL